MAWGDFGYFILESFLSPAHTYFGLGGCGHFCWTNIPMEHTEYIIDLAWDPALGRRGDGRLGLGEA
jgi:hypothetical protein